MQLTVVIPARNEASNLRELLPKLHHVLGHLVGGAYEILVVDGDSEDETGQVVAEQGAQLVHQNKPGYGGALQAGFDLARGGYILTMDGDLSHDPEFVERLWYERNCADVIVASRYWKDSATDADWLRNALSRVLNRGMHTLLNVNLTDFSSGFRLYRAEVVKGMPITQRNFSSLTEILIQSYAGGWRVTEIPFDYRARKYGSSQARLFEFGLGFLHTAYQMWKLRNSIACADYDARAYDSRIPFQRYWQRTRYRIVTGFARGATKTLDIGCGSSRILTGLQGEVVGLDIQINKLRYVQRTYGVAVVKGTLFSLPFPNESFDCVVCSQVIEHIPADPIVFMEMIRVLQPGGRLVLGTPDYSTLSWPIIERLYSLAAPGAYAVEHITHYTRADLITILEGYGLQVEAVDYVFGSELVILARRLNS